MLLLGAFQSFGLNSVLGMESTLAALVTVALFVCLNRYLERKTAARALGIGLLALALGVTRPEANLLNAIALLGTLTGLRGADKKQFTRAVCAGYVLPGIVYFAWRVWYYGHWFPLPFYVKQGALGDGVTGTGYVRQFFLAVPISFWLVAAAGVAVCWRRSLLPALAALAAIASFAHSCPLNGVAWRYFVPYYPVLFALFGVGLLTPFLAKTQRARQPAWAGAAGAAMAALVFLQFSFFTHGFAAFQSAQEQTAAALQDNHVRLGLFLASVRGIKPNPTIACGDAGAIEYYGRWRFVDENRLNDPHLALMTAGDEHYVAQFHPDLIVVQSTRPDLFAPQQIVRCQAAYYRLAQDSRMAHLGTLRCGPSDNFLIYGCPASAVARSLRAYFQR